MGRVLECIADPRLEFGGGPRQQCGLLRITILIRQPDARSQLPARRGTGRDGTFARLRSTAASVPGSSPTGIERHAFRQTNVELSRLPSVIATSDCENGSNAQHGIETEMS
jgi:hypothetical protein